MIIENRDNVPKAYSSKSRDYQVLLKLLDLSVNSIKNDLEEYYNLLNPNKCPDNMLPLLASYLEYEYDNNQTANSNRLIMRYFPNLLRNKGNEIGMKLAVLLSCEISNYTNIDVSRIIATYDYSNATIYVYYPDYLNKVRDLIEVVRPAGMKVVLLSYTYSGIIEEMDIYDDVYVINKEIYVARLRESGDTLKPTYVVDSDNNVIGICTDSRSCISDDYKSASESYLGNVDIHLYAEKIKACDNSPESQTSKTYDSNVNRVGFGEIAGIYSEEE